MLLTDCLGDQYSDWNTYQSSVIEMADRLIIYFWIIAGLHLEHGMVVTLSRDR